MGLSKTIWSTPTDYLVSLTPENPVLFFAPQVLQEKARVFIDGFPGLVTYAVKANPMEEVIQNLSSAGVQGFDVASPFEMRLIRRLAPDAVLHYNNPVRSNTEIAVAVGLGVKSFSVDSMSELDKLIAAVPAEGIEIAVRFKLQVGGAAYNFGAKFGAISALAVGLLRKVADAGFVPSLTFHPGTQCTDPAAWESYIHEAARIAKAAGVTVARLNMGGGFPSHRLQAVTPDLHLIFKTIDAVTTAAFGVNRPQLVCEPGRGLCGDAFSVATRVKAVRDGAHVFLNDGVYGTLTEFSSIGATDRLRVIAPCGAVRRGAPVGRPVFGPTCDSIDSLPADLWLPADLTEGDYVLFHGMGAYTTVTNTRFNGYGELGVETVLSLYC